MATLTFGVVGLHATTTLDMWVVRILFESRNDFGIAFFSLMTRFGDGWTIGICLVLASLVLLQSKHSKAWVAGLLVATLGAKISEIAIKILIGRERPGDFALLHLDTFSFPSGHATAAMALYGFIAYLVWSFYPRFRFLILPIGIVLVALVSASRVYLGVHYPSDVLGGLVLGGIWIVIGIGTVRYVRT